MKILTGLGQIRRRGLRSPSRWLLLGCFLIFLLLALNAILFMTYRRVHGTIARELGERLMAIANATAAGISADDIICLANDPASPEAQRVQEMLQRVRFETSLAEIYLFDVERRHLLDADRHYGRDYANPALELHYGAATAALTGIAAASDLYRLGPVYLRTAFAPVLGPAGEVVAVVGVEGGANFFLGFATLRRQILVSGAVGMIAVLALALFFSRLLRTQTLAERTLRETSALTAAGELAAILAHEIRNPLAIISARAERVRAKIEQDRSPEEVLKWFDAIPGEVERLNRILTQYLTFARPGDLEEDAAEWDATITAALSLLEGDFARKGITFIREDQSLMQVRIAMAPAALHQVLLNLLLNARDAMPKGGELRLLARDLGRQLEIQIIDSGCGMNDEQIRSVFEAFYTTKPKGSGLGLAVVRSMLDLYGGRVTVASEPEVGTTFTLLLRKEQG